jgi:NAD(P)H-flavin reductase
MIKPIRTNGELISKRFVTESILELQYKTDVALPFVPGHYVNISVTAPFKRPYSIAWSEDSVLTFLVEVRDPGKGSDFFRMAQIGSQTEIMGPLGRFTLQDSDLPKVFISTGTGAAPFISMIKRAMSRGHWAMGNQDNALSSQSTAHRSSPIAFFHGMRYEKDDFPYQYLDKEIDSDRLDYYRCITRENVTLDELNKVKYRSGRVTQVVPLMQFDWPNTEFYICGSNDMVKEMRTILLEKGAVRVFIENYG